MQTQFDWPPQLGWWKTFIRLTSQKQRWMAVDLISLRSCTSINTPEPSGGGAAGRQPASREPLTGRESESSAVMATNCNGAIYLPDHLSS
jgi:hypothetical protein